MDISKFMKQENEKPLDNIVVNGGFCGIFRTVACIGDSLSSGEFEGFINGHATYHDYFEYSWGQYMARDTGAKVYNFSRGGMTAREYCETFAKENGFWDRELAAQAYIIALGVNDISEVVNEKPVTFGSIDDVDGKDWANNKPTFAGYYAEIIARYKEIQPKAKFFLMTIPDGEENEKREPYNKRHRELLYKLAEKFDNCYVLDFKQYAPVYDKKFKETFFMAGHMSPAGYRLTALMVESYIDYIIRNHAEDFKQVGFIGTPYHNANEKW